MNKEVQNLESIISAQESIIAWYEDDHGRWDYEDENIPEDLLELEQKLEAAKKL